VSAKKKGDNSGVRKAGFITNLIGVLFLVLIVILFVITVGLGVMVPATVGYTNKAKKSAAEATAHNVHTAVCTAVLDPDAINSDDYAEAMYLLSNGVYMSDMSRDDNTVYGLIFENLVIEDASEIIEEVKDAGGYDIYIDYDVDDNTCSVDVAGTDISVSDD
jgi:hypothetical protein